MPSKFDDADEPADKAIADNAGRSGREQRADDPVVHRRFTPENADLHVGGAAIVLKNLDPAITPSEIKDRIERQRLQPQTDPADGRLPRVRCRVARRQRRADHHRRRAGLRSEPPVRPATPNAGSGELVPARCGSSSTTPSTSPPQLQKVSNFGPRSPATPAAAATAALLFSIVAIMVYIWFRFGNLKYGTATVVAMLHDTLLVVGAIGLAHYLADTSVGRCPAASSRSA